MTPTKFCFLFLVAALAVPKLSAAAGDEPKHNVDFPKGDASWSVVLRTATANSAATPPSAQAKAPRVLVKVVVVRKGNLRHDVQTYSDGTPGEFWWTSDPALVLLQVSPDRGVQGFRASMMEDERYDETTLSWVGKATFKGMKPYGGKNCRYYEERVKLVDGETKLIQTWIDDQTARPVATGNDGTIALFTFDLAVPDAPLTLPDKFQTEYARWATELQPPKRLGRH